jgi:hypothetical protein
MPLLSPLKEVYRAALTRQLPVVNNAFNLGTPLLRAEHYRNFGEAAFGCWVEAVA